MMRLINAIRHPRHHEWWALRPWRRHSMVLMFAGVVYIFFGLTSIGSDLGGADPEVLESYKVLLAVLSLDAWGVMWIVVGCLAILSSRWPPASETWGYSALAGMSTLWGSMLSAGVLFGAPSQALSGGMVWFLLAFIWWAISGLVNPAEIVKDEPLRE